MADIENKGFEFRLRPYCQYCPNFEPDIDKIVNPNGRCFNDIRCKNDILCANLMNFLRRDGTPDE